MSSSILFYSNKCKHSRKALEIINANNINIRLSSFPKCNLVRLLRSSITLSLKIESNKC